MDKDTLVQLCQSAIGKMNAGDFRGALDVAYMLRGLGPNYLVSFLASGLLIDIGSALTEEKITREGVRLLQKDFKAIVQHKEHEPDAHYNLANGLSALFKFKWKKDTDYPLFRKTELDEARSHYRRALECNPEDSILVSQILVNLANCFDHLGRVADALKLYDESLELRPDHGMALGNKGLALLHYAVLAGEHQATYELEAHSLLSKALEMGVDPEARETFANHLLKIRKHFSNEQILDKPLEFPGITREADTDFGKFLIDFCLKNQLYLNPCSFCEKCDAAIGDPVLIRKMLVHRSPNERKDLLESDAFLRLSGYLNQIKQDYVTARFLLILSQYKRLNLDFVDKRVRIIDTFDYTIHNIYIQLVKASFKGFYDTLDKIGFFINDYLRLGIPEKQVNFRQIWYTRRKEVRRKIEDTKNFSLNALFDLHRDFEEGRFVMLRKTRNALTHRFVNIRAFQDIEDEENMREETLVKQTVELGRAVRNAILYLLHFVHVEERKKEARTKGTSLPLYALDLLDDMKSRR